MVVEPPKKKEKKVSEGAPDYMVTYGDLMSLLLTFFIMLISAAKIEGQDFRLILANFPGLGNFLGGNSFNKGKLPESGQVFEALPSVNQGSALDKLKNTSVQILQSQIVQDQVRVLFEERGLVISLASDFYFEKYSANLSDNQGIETIRKISSLLREFFIQNPTVPFRIEGFTDEVNFPVGTPYVDEWGLSAARSITILRLLDQFLVPLINGQVAGFGNTKPIYESTGEGSVFNRRVDIIVINEGNL